MWLSNPIQTRTTLTTMCMQSGVHEISSMKPAMLGQTKFDQSSPTALIEANTLQRKL